MMSQTMRVSMWDPAHSDVRVQGQLTIASTTPRRRLSLDGKGGDLSRVQEALSSEDGYIHGEVIEPDPDLRFVDRPSNEALTVFGPLSYQWDLPPSATVSIELEPTAVVFGGHVVPDDVYAIGDLHVDLMEAVLEIPNIKSKHKLLDQDDVRIELDVPKMSLEAPTGNGTVSIFVGHAESISRDRHEIEMTVTCQFHTATTLTLRQWLSDLVEPIEYLVAFLTDLPPTVTALKLWSTEEPETWPVEVHTDAIGATSVYSPEDIRNYNSLLALEDDEISRTLLSGWFTEWPRLKNVLSLLLGDRWDAKRSTPELGFLVKVQAAEGYHRASTRFDQQARPEERHDALVEAVLAVEELTKAERDWIKPRVQYNEPSLRKRLRDLMKPLNSEFGLVFGTDRMGGLIEQTVLTRNALSHRLDTTESEDSGFVDDDFALNLYGELIGMFVRTHILLDLGLDLADAAVAIKGSRAGRWASDQFQPYLHRLNASSRAD